MEREKNQQTGQTCGRSGAGRWSYPVHGGSRSCHNTGYKGRTAIHEIIVSSNDIKELISSGATAEQIGAQAEKNGTKLLRSNVTDMVLAGTTTLDELVKATYSV